MLSRADLNERQQQYLQAIYETDQAKVRVADGIGCQHLNGAGCPTTHRTGTSEQCPLNPNRGEQSKTVTNEYATL